jgi:hypothetical protein
MQVVYVNAMVQLPGGPLQEYVFSFARLQEMAS